jgi:hypothetical protein
MESHFLVGVAKLLPLDPFEHTSVARARVRRLVSTVGVTCNPSTILVMIRTTAIVDPGADTFTLMCPEITLYPDGSLLMMSFTPCQRRTNPSACGYARVPVRQDSFSWRQMSKNRA